jgi:hypothetical protein
VEHLNVVFGAGHRTWLCWLPLWSPDRINRVSQKSRPLIGIEDWSHNDLQDQKQNNLGGFVMPSRIELASRARARERARHDLASMPISDDENLLKLQDQAEEYLREAKRRNPSEPDELISTVIDGVSRKYFLYAVRKKQTWAFICGFLAPFNFGADEIEISSLNRIHGVNRPCFRWRIGKQDADHRRHDRAPEFLDGQSEVFRGLSWTALLSRTRSVARSRVAWPNRPSFVWRGMMARDNWKNWPRDSQIRPVVAFRSSPRPVFLGALTNVGFPRPSLPVARFGDNRPAGWMRRASSALGPETPGRFGPTSDTHFGGVDWYRKKSLI